MSDYAALLEYLNQNPGGSAMKQPKVEWATVCAHYPQPGHRAHLYRRGSEAKARQAVIDQDHHAEMLKAKGYRHWYIGEAPFRVVSRTVSEWADADADPQPEVPGQLTIDDEPEREPSFIDGRNV